MISHFKFAHELCVSSSTGISFLHGTWPFSLVRTVINRNSALKTPNDCRGDHPSRSQMSNLITRTDWVPQNGMPSLAQIGVRGWQLWHSPPWLCGKMETWTVIILDSSFNLLRISRIAVVMAQNYWHHNLSWPMITPLKHLSIWMHITVQTLYIPPQLKFLHVATRINIKILRLKQYGHQFADRRHFPLTFRYKIMFPSKFHWMVYSLSSFGLSHG